MFYRLALAAVKLMVNSKFFGSDGEQIVIQLYCRNCLTYIKCTTDPSQWVTQFLATLSIEQRGEWLVTALAIPRLAWNSILKLWLQYCSNASHSISTKPHSTGQRPPPKPSVIPPDVLSEIVAVSQWPTIWSWLPDWVTSNQPQCLFQSSKHGYK